MDLSTKTKDDATQNPATENNLRVQIDLKRLDNMPALENAINKSRDKPVSIGSNTTSDTKESVAKISGKEAPKNDVKAKRPSNVGHKDNTVSIKHNLPVFAIPEREKYKIPKPKDVPPIVTERCSVETQTDGVIFCSKEDHEILQLIKSNGVTIDALTRLITTGDINNNSNRQSNLESSNTIIIDLDDDGDDETDNEIIQSIISKSDKNKAVLNKLYDSMNKVTAERVVEENTLLENRNNKILVMTKLCTALLGKISTYIMMPSPHKTFCDKDTQTENANKKRKASTSTEKNIDKLFGAISAEELLQLEADGMGGLVENKILQTQLLQQQAQQANYYQQPIQEPVHPITTQQQPDIRPPYIPQMMPGIPVVQTPQLRPTCPPSRYPIGGSMYNPDGIQCYPNGYTPIFSRLKNPTQFKNIAQQRPTRKFFPNQTGVGATPLLATSSLQTENARFEHQHQQQQQIQQQWQQQFHRQIPAMIDQQRIQQMELQKNDWESQLLNYPNSAWSRSVREAHSI